MHLCALGNIVTWKNSRKTLTGGQFALIVCADAALAILTPMTLDHELSLLQEVSTIPLAAASFHKSRPQGLQ